MNTTLLILTIIQSALAVLKAQPGLNQTVLTYIADGEDAFTKALAEHNAAQTNQTKPLNQIDPIA